MTRYVRTRGGSIVHLTGCSYVGPLPKPWNWAENRPVYEILESIRGLGIRGCARCRPFNQPVKGVAQ